MKIAVLPNLDKRGSSDVVDKLGSILQNEGIEAYLPENIKADGFINLPEDKLYKAADLIITIGGDGTIIRYAKRAALDDKPVLGINAGRVGYLANIEQNELSLLSKLKKKEYFVEKRMMLSVSVCENGRKINEYNALNDAVITSGFISRIIDISVYLGRDSISYRADGLIMSTPTGSTAYSMSAGGPIIDPLTESMCITPICSHSLSAKPILLGADNTVKLKAFSKKRTDIYLTVDGKKVCSVKPYTDIYISKSKQFVKLIRLNDRSFYKTLSNKFRDGRSM
ncbi:MAG: NAD(+)/NADH kinase [Acutalibacteraceae bacterium]|nr:NAD(+)/NADH kinase [Acutalibacteraceae bacterium]